MRVKATALIIAFALSTAACGPGDGSSLDELGRSEEHPHAPGVASSYGAITFSPTYRQISREFFGRFCVSCHAGPSAPKGLDLTEERAYDHLVGAPSAQRPELLRVDPAAPERSYLLIKLMGETGMSGRQMPRNRPARPEVEIEVIRSWIAEGAARN